jgi:hypothetical protein
VAGPDQKVMRMRDVMFGRQDSKPASKFAGQPSFAVAVLTAGLLCSVASSALAQSAKSTAADLAIEAAVPKTDPAQVDLNIAAPASIVKEAKPASAAAAKAEPSKTDTTGKVNAAKADTGKTDSGKPGAPPQRQQEAEPRR